MTVLIALACLFILAPLGVIWSGYVLSVLWAWFLVPTLGLPTLSIPAAIGIAMVVSYMTHQRHEYKPGQEQAERVKEDVCWLVLKPAFALGFGWVVAQWM